MFKEMRKKERQLPSEDILRIIKNGEYGILASLGDNGYAYAVPLSYVYENHCIYFHCALEGQKLENIKGNPKVSFCVVGNTEVLASKFSTKFESVIAFGIASIVEGEEKTNVLSYIIKKYSKDFIEEGQEYINRAQAATKIVKIQIEHITGKGRY